MQRLDKILSEAGAASRRELRAIIRAGRVTVNGKKALREDEKFDEASVEILLDGSPVRLRTTVLVMLHKPAGYVTSTDDPSGPTVMELIPEEFKKLGVMPVGRLDKATEGLLLLTNDGVLAHKLISPRQGIWKTYYARHEGQAGEEDVAVFASGMTLGDGTKCLPARLIPLGPGESLVEVQEGKYHQVRRMLACRQMPVSYLKRLAEGDITLGDLEKGECRELPLTALDSVLG